MWKKGVVLCWWKMLVENLELYIHLKAVTGHGRRAPPMFVEKKEEGEEY